MLLNSTEQQSGIGSLACLPTLDETCEQEATVIQKWKVAKAEWPAFRDRCHQYITVPSANDVAMFSENLTLSIQGAAETTVPQTKPKRVQKCKR